MRRFLLLLILLHPVLCLPVIAQSNQTVVNGAVTTAVNFGGAGCVYKWTNSNPAIGLPASGTGDIAPFTAVNKSAAPITASITATPVSMGYAYIVSSAAELTVINTLTDQVKATSDLTIHPYGETVSPDGRFLYVTDPYNNTVTIFDNSDNVTIASVYTGSNSNPRGIAVSPDGSKIYVADEYPAFTAGGTVTVIDAATYTVMSVIKVGISPLGIAISPDGKFAYVANQGSNTVSVINCVSNTVSYSVPVGLNPNAITVGGNSGELLYVANGGSNSVTVINTLTKSAVNTIPVGFNPAAIVISPDRQFVYVLNEDALTVSVIDTKTNQVTTTIPENIGQSPIGISITPDGGKLYVVNQDGNVEVISTSTNQVISVIKTEIGATSFGSFVSNGLGCNSSAVSFTITVNPTPPPPSINFDATALKSLTTTYGTPSASTSFTIFALNLRAGILITPPPGFEISTDNSTFSSSVTVGAAGTLALTTVYLRLAAITAVGSYAGSFGVSSPQAHVPDFIMAESTVTPATLVIKADDVEKTYGLVLTGGSVTNGFTTTGLQNGDTLGDLTVKYKAGSSAADPVGTYNGSVILSPGTGGHFSASNYVINYKRGNIIIQPAPLLATVDNKSKVFDLPNPVFTITYSGFVNNEDAAVFTSPPAITTTAVTNSPAGEYTITAGGAEAQNYTLTYLPGVLTINPLAQEIIIPNAFTPNGDGINDFWDIKYLNLYPKCTVNIYTRYGEKVYSSIGYSTSWDGTYKGERLPMGTYYYVINTQSGSKLLSGYITIIR